MQKFTRALTREIEVAGERLAVTLSAEGLSVRPVGARRPPRTMSWAAWACACAGRPAAGPEPTEAELAQAVKVLKAGGEKAAAGKEKEGAAGGGGETAAPKPAASSAPAPAPAPTPGAHPATAGPHGGQAGTGEETTHRAAPHAP